MAADEADGVGDGPGAPLVELLAGHRQGKPPRAPRFYRRATVEPVSGGFALRLDGRGALTPARNPLVLPTARLGDAVAEEWNGQADTIDPTAMPVTRMANTAIDGVGRQMPAVLAEVRGYLRSDLLVYRAGEPAALVAVQAQAWDPILAWLAGTWGVRFELAEGVTFVPQSDATLATLADALEVAVGSGAGAPFRLTGLHVMTTLTGSALLALAIVRGRLTPEDAWAAAHLDETFQESRWGQDAEALERRGARGVEMRAAAALFALSR